MIQATKSIEQTVAAINALDLDPIKVKLMDPEEGQGWTREYVDRVEIAYRRFLTLLVTFPDETIAPTKDVDKFWHGHILDTMKYAEDCERVFGYFLHHFPYFGMRGEQDAANLRDASSRMHSIYEREFGESMPAANAAWCMAAQKASAWCMAAKPAAKSGSAWCMAAKPLGTSAWCMAAKPAAMSNDAAWCMAARKASAWCMAAQPSRIEMDVNLRPSLAPAG
jgi:hypothetical protein